MPSFQIKPDEFAQLKQLFACEDIRILADARGGNSKVFCVEAEGKKWAVKSYPPYAPNQRDRLAAECMAYEFLNEHQIQSVPRFKASCLNFRWLIMDWIEGSIPTHYGHADIEQAIEFIRQIGKLNQSAAAKTLPLAAEACLSLDDLILQVRKRFDRLRAVAENNSTLEHFLTNRFSPIFDRAQAEAKAAYHQSQMDSSTELNEAYRSLIPADFGFHNSLRDESGRLYFFDFDYFGWDDPVKLLADILWHPKMALTQDQRQNQVIKG